MMDSDFEVSAPALESQPSGLFRELDRGVTVNCDRPNCSPLSVTSKLKGWDRLENALGKGTSPYPDAGSGRIVRISNSRNNTLFFERLCDGKWRWTRYLGYPGVIQFTELK